MLCLFSLNGMAFDAFNIDPELKRENLSHFLYYQSDLDKDLSINDILNGASNTQEWQRNGDQALNLGFKFHYYWLAIQFHNGADQAVEKLVEVPYALLDIVDFYEVKSGSVANNSLQGNLIPFADRIYEHRYYLYPIKLKPQESATLYIHVKGSASLQVPIFLWDLNHFWQKDQGRLAIQTIYVGTMLIMICYHLFLAWGTRDKMYLYYVGIMASTVTFIPTYHGVAQQFYWPSFPILNTYGASMPVPIANLLITLFAMEILNTKTLIPKSHQLLKGVVVALMVGITAALLLPYHYVMPLITGTVFLTFTLLLIVCLYAWKRSQLEGRIFITAYSVFLLGSLSMALNKFGAIPANLWTESFVQIGSIIETILLSLALAARINRLRADSVQLIKAEMKAKEAELIAQQEINEGKAKTQFLAMMSHEIRTPMNGVLGLLDILKGTPLNNKQHHLVETIESSGEMLLTIINDILDFSKADADKLDLESVPINLNQLIVDCSLLYSAGAKQKSILLLSYVSPRIPEVIQGDPTRLKQVINNLLGNAFKFTNKGHVLLKADYIYRLDNHRIRIEVEDTGIGVSPSQLNRLFTSFSQADSSTTRKFGGTGLGLAISKKIVEAMGGEIGVDSEMGQGSTFWLEIPVNTQPKAIPSTPLSLLLCTDYPRLGHVISDTFIDIPVAVKTVPFDLLAQFLESNATLEYDNCLLYNQSSNMEIDTIAETIINRSSTAMPVYNVETHLSNLLGEHQEHNYQTISPPISLNLFTHDSREEPSSSGSNNPQAMIVSDAISQLNVLVAEDNQINQMVIKGILSPLVKSIELVTNGQEAVNRFEANRESYDLIFMDCEMPIMDGYEATRQIRAFESQNQISNPITIIALTAHAFDQFKNKALDAGMDGHLAKPVNTKMIVQFLTQLVEKSERTVIDAEEKGSTF